MDRADTLPVIDGNRLRLLPVEQILALVPRGRHTRILTCDGAVLSNQPPRQLAARLDPDRFRPIHRDSFIRIDAIERMVRGDHEQLLVKLRDCDELFPVSPAHTDLFREL